MHRTHVYIKVRCALSGRSPIYHGSMDACNLCKAAHYSCYTGSEALSARPACLCADVTCGRTDTLLLLLFLSLCLPGRFLCVNTE